MRARVSFGVRERPHLLAVVSIRNVWGPDRILVVRKLLRSHPDSFEGERAPVAVISVAAPMLPGAVRPACTALKRPVPQTVTGLSHSGSSVTLPRGETDVVVPNGGADMAHLRERRQVPYTDAVGHPVADSTTVTGQRPRRTCVCRPLVPSAVAHRLRWRTLPAGRYRGGAPIAGIPPVPRAPHQYQSPG